MNKEASFYNPVRVTFLRINRKNLIGSIATFDSFNKTAGDQGKNIGKCSYIATYKCLIFQQLRYKMNKLHVALYNNNVMFTLEIYPLAIK